MINLKFVLLLVFGPLICSGGGGASVFSRSNIHLVATSISILGCIVFTLVMELALNQLEHIAKADEAKNAFVHKMYEEMITLGFFSFGLILLIDFQVFEGKEKKAGLLKFEFAHLWLFMFGMFMVLQNLVGFMVIHRIEKNWIRADHLGIEKLMEKVNPDELAKFKLEEKKNGYSGESSNTENDKSKDSPQKSLYKPRSKCVLAVFGGGKIFDLMEYEAMKHIFMTQNKDIKSVEDFRFAKYLQRATSQSISEHLEDISYTKWLILILVGVGYIALIHYWNKNEPKNNEDLWFSFGFSWVLGLFSIILMIISRNAKKKLISLKAYEDADKEKYDGEEAVQIEEKANTDIKLCPPEDYPKLLSYIYNIRQKAKKAKSKATKAHDGHGDHDHKEHGEHEEAHEENHGHHGGGKAVAGCCGKTHETDEEDVLIKNKQGLLPCGMKTHDMLWLNDMVTLLQCFYLGLFVTLISSLAITDFGGLGGVLYMLAILVEQFVVMLGTGPCLVKDIVLIQSMLHAKGEIVEEVLDEVIELEKIRDQISKAIQKEFKDSYNRELELRNCYRELDSDGSGTLGSKELKAMLATKLKTKVHGRQCDLIIQEMDEDLSGEVDFQEFMKYLNLDPQTLQQE